MVMGTRKTLSLRSKSIDSKKTNLLLSRIIVDKYEMHINCLRIFFKFNKRQNVSLLTVTLGVFHLNHPYNIAQLLRGWP